MPIVANGKAKVKAPPKRKVDKAVTQPQSFSNLVDARDMESLFSRYDTEDRTQLPPLTALGIDLQGKSKVGKSTLIAGNERLAIAKLPDGMSAARKCKAKIFNINSLAEFWDWVDSMMEVFSKHGTNGRFLQVAIDPMFKLVQWLMAEQLEMYRTQHAWKLKNKDIQYTEPKHISEIPGVGPYFKVADAITNMLGRFNSLGIGWISVTHYNLKVVYVDGKPSDYTWQPDIPPTSARAIANISDILLVAQKIPSKKGQPTFGLAFEQEKNSPYEELGGRVPLTGGVVLPHYDDKKTPLMDVSWSVFEDQYSKATDVWESEQDRFRQGL